METKLNNLGYKILTKDGFKSFEGISCKKPQQTYQIETNDNNIMVCTLNHKINTPNGLKPLNELKINDVIYNKNSETKITKIIPYEFEPVFDILEVADGNKFLCNDIDVSNCEFIGKSNTLIDNMILRDMVNKNRDITYIQLIDSDVRVYSELNPYKKYMLSIDTGMGIENDFSSIQVFEFPGFKQVIEWKSDRLNQNQQIEKLKNITEWIYSQLKSLGNRLPEIYWSIENNGSAEGFICALREKSEQVANEYNVNTGVNYIKRAKLINEKGNKRIGFTTTSANKNIACSQLKILIESNQMKILSNDYLSQLGTFTGDYAKRGYSAKKGNNDDLISASLTIILMYLQEKTTLDLNREIIPTPPSETQQFWDDDLPFLIS